MDKVLTQISAIAKVLNTQRRLLFELLKSLPGIKEDIIRKFAIDFFYDGQNKPAQYRRFNQERTCKQCGKTFIGRGFIYCSVLCAAAAKKRKPRKVKCVTCGVEFETKLAKKYCDKCKKSIFKPSAKICPNCGKEFLISQRAQKYCSRDCKNRYLAKNKHKDRIRIDYLKSVGKCEGCGESDKRVLHVHHVKGRDNPELMVLCANCHYKYHNSIGKGVNSENRTKEEVLKVLGIIVL